MSFWSSFSPAISAEGWVDRAAAAGAGGQEQMTDLLVCLGQVGELLEQPLPATSAEGFACTWRGRGAVADDGPVRGGGAMFSDFLVLAWTWQCPDLSCPHVMHRSWSQLCKSAVTVLL